MKVENAIYSGIISNNGNQGLGNLQVSINLIAYKLGKLFFITKALITII